jgi:hypothetical protein
LRLPLNWGVPIMVPLTTGGVAGGPYPSVRGAISLANASALTRCELVSVAIMVVVPVHCVPEILLCQIPIGLVTNISDRTRAYNVPCQRPPRVIGIIKFSLASQAYPAMSAASSLSPRLGIIPKNSAPFKKRGSLFGGAFHRLPRVSQFS